MFMYAATSIVHIIKYLEEPLIVPEVEYAFIYS